MAWEDESQSSGFDASTIGYLRESGVEVEYAAGEVIVRRGEVGRALYVVLAGEVDVCVGRGVQHLTLCRMGPGSTFGEVSILRNVPTSADVLAHSPVRILEYPAALFPKALVERESLMRKIMGRLAKNLQHTTADAWELFRKAEALRALVRHEGGGETMIAASARSRALLAALKRRAEAGTPVLLCGEEGTGKLLGARTVHDASEVAGGPFVVVDCGRLLGDAAADLFALPEAEEGSEPSGLQIAAGGSLVLASAEALPPGVQRELAAFLARRQEQAQRAGPGAGARLLATSRAPERLTPELADCFGEPVELPPLRERAREILPLAEQFLARVAGSLGRERRLDASAERVLVSLRYRYRNVAELRDIVELAARCAEGSEVRAEHIVAGIGPDEEPVGVGVPAGSGLDRVLRSRAPTLLRGLTLVGFLAVIVLGLAAAGSAAARTANGLIWSLWEPAVFALFLVAGPLWCTVCPLSTAGRLAQRLGCLGRPLPAWLKSRGVWLGAAGLLFILWVERAGGMLQRPAASALLLLGLLAASVGFCLVFRREVWCRHVCPLGRLAVVVAPAAPVTLAAHRRVCASTCTSHECYRGTVSVPGCTVFHHPQLASQSHNCKLCLDCLRTCPHGATTLYLRAPLGGVAGLATADAYVVPFALSVFVLAPLFVAAEKSPSLGRPLWLGLAGLGGLVLAALLSRGLPWLLHGRSDSDSPAVAQTALGLAVLGWGPLLAYQLGHVGALAHIRLMAEPGLGVGAAAVSGIDLQTLARVGVVLATALAGALVLRRARRADASIRPHGWRIVVVIAWLYVAGSLVLAL